MGNKLILNERYSGSQLEYSSEPSLKNNNCLGHLAGIGAEFNKPTRNGHRYPLELWRNVINSEDFKEGMDSHTIFSENDHPEDRADTSIKLISAVLTKMEIRESEGIVWTEFDILDTPQGRILKTLIDYGCKIGVSSRGLGDEIVKDGETIIDPDTYIYYGHDMVVTPAVKSARPDVTESVDKTSSPKSISESIHREIEDATTKIELESIRKISESVNLPDIETINEAIDSKLSSFTADNNVVADNDMLLETKQLTESNDKLKAANESLKKKIEANNIRSKEIRKALKESRANSRELSKMLQESRRSNIKLEHDLMDGISQIDDLSEELSAVRASSKVYRYKLLSKIESLERENNSLRSHISDLTDENNDLNENIDSLNEELKEQKSRTLSYKSQLEKAKLSSNDKIAALNSRVSTLVESNKSLNRDLAQARSQSKTLTKKLESINDAKKLTESNARKSSANLTNQLKTERAKYKTTLAEYIKVKCAQSGLKVSTVKTLLPNNYTAEDVNKLVSELSSRKDRINKMPIAVQPRTAILGESLGNMTAEDAQTMTILSGDKL